MKTRDILVRILDCLYREPMMSLKQFMRNKNIDKINSEVEPYVFMVDGYIPHGGMFDRLKGLITIYAIAKAQNKSFKIYWKYPFSLSQYLEPSSYDWLCEADQLRHSPFSYRNVIAYGEINNPSRLLKDRKCETHFYYGFNSLDKVNKHFNTHFEWGTLYRELFQPTEYLQKYLEVYQKEIGAKYIAIHTRFLNLLGDKTETSINPELEDSAAKQHLMHSAINAIKHIKLMNEGKRILIASDSMTFLNILKKSISDVYIVPGTVKHIDTAGVTDDSENIKMFTDYYLISNAQKVYSLWHEGMWKSAFPEYAARIGNVPFERIEF